MYTVYIVTLSGRRAVGVPLTGPSRPGQPVPPLRARGPRPRRPTPRPHQPPGQVACGMGKFELQKLNLVPLVTQGLKNCRKPPGLGVRTPQDEPNPGEASSCDLVILILLYDGYKSPVLLVVLVEVMKHPLSCLIWRIW